MPFRNDMFDYHLNIPSAQRDTAVSYARRLLKCICSLLVLIAIIVTATAVCCSILVYEQVSNIKIFSNFDINLNTCTHAHTHAGVTKKSNPNGIMIPGSSNSNSL